MSSKGPMSTICAPIRERSQRTSLDIPPRGGGGGVWMSLVPNLGGVKNRKKTFLSGIKFLIELYYQIFDFFWHFLRKKISKFFFCVKHTVHLAKSYPDFAFWNLKSGFFQNQKGIDPYMHILTGHRMEKFQKVEMWAISKNHYVPKRYGWALRSMEI